MAYVQYDANGNLLRVEEHPFNEMQAQLDNDQPELKAWLAAQEVEQSLQQLQRSDQEMIRVLEDVINALISKDILRITDLPEEAQAKLLGRSRARDVLNSNALINDEEELSLL